MHIAIVFEIYRQNNQDFPFQFTIKAKDEILVSLNCIANIHYFLKFATK
jgi:hypothetical protein